MKLLILFSLIFIVFGIGYAANIYEENEYVILDEKIKNNDPYILNFKEKIKCKISWAEKKKKKFGEDTYNTVKAVEKDINKKFKEFVIPDFLPQFMKENINIKIDYEKDIVLSVTYCQKY